MAYGRMGIPLHLLPLFTLIVFGCVDKGVEDRVRLRGFGGEFWMVLYADGKGVVVPFDRFYQIFTRCTGDTEAAFLELCGIVHVKLIAMAVAFADGRCAVILFQARCRALFERYRHRVASCRPCFSRPLVWGAGE